MGGFKVASRGQNGPIKHLLATCRDELSIFRMFYLQTHIFHAEAASVDMEPLTLAQRLSDQLRVDGGSPCLSEC